MPFKKGQSGNPVGRKSGTLNALSKSAKDNISAVFDQIGGSPKMAEWASANPTEFYKLYARLLPHELTGAGGSAFRLELPWLEKVAQSRGWASTSTGPESHSSDSTSEGNAGQ